MIHKLLAIAVVLLTFGLVCVVLNLSRCLVLKLVTVNGIYKVISYNAIGTYIVTSYNALVYFIHLASDSSFYLLHRVTADCCSFEKSFFPFDINKALGSHSSFIDRCTFIKTLITIYIQLDGSYMFRSTTIIRELAIEPG